jgi:hypothetical protein
LPFRAGLTGKLHLWLWDTAFFTTLCSSSISFADSASLTLVLNAVTLQNSTSLLFLHYPCASVVFFNPKLPTIFPNTNRTSVHGNTLGTSNPTHPKFSMPSSPSPKCLPF